MAWGFSCTGRREDRSFLAPRSTSLGPRPDSHPRDELEVLGAEFVLCSQTLPAPVLLVKLLSHVLSPGEIPPLGCGRGISRVVSQVAYIQGAACHSQLHLSETRVVLDLILSHSATVPKPSVEARDFSGQPGIIKLHKTLSLLPLGIL